MKFLRTAALFVGGLLPLAAAVAPANAATVTFDWTLTAPAASLGGFEFTGSGTITANTTATAGVDIATGITGEVNGSTITALLAPGTFESNDNLLFPNGVSHTNPTKLDGDGIAFAIAAGNLDVFSFGGNGTGNAYGEFSPSGFGVGTFALTPVSATPLPPTWTIMLIGLVGLGFFVVRGGKKPAADFAAA